MNTSFKLVAVVALMVVGQVFAASTITYTLELGGNNNRAGWKAGAFPTYSRDPDGLIPAVNAGAVVSWAVVVEVDGAHDDPGGLGHGIVPAGAANLVFDLELHKDSVAGPIVAIGSATLDGSGNPTTAGWYSSINDDTAGFFGVDAKENAAYAVAFDVNGTGGAHGQVFSPAASDGPYMDFYHYPAAQGHPAGSTAEAGKLIGMGVGYKEFKGTLAGGPNTAGVGIASTAAIDCVALGIKPIFEGQIKTPSDLATGTYHLVLKASTGNNVLPGENFGSYDICSSANIGRFAVPANVVEEDSVAFDVIGPSCTNPSVSSAVSNKTHTGGGTFGVNLPGIEPRTGGPTSVVVTFSGNVQANSGNASVAVSSGTVTNVAAAGNQVTVTMNGASNTAACTMTFPGISLQGNAGCAATGSVCIRSLYGDANQDGTNNIFDLIAIRNVLNQAVAIGNFTKDVDASNAINIFDLIAVRNNLNQTVAACP